MFHLHRALAAPVGALVLAAFAAAPSALGQESNPLPPAELKDFSQTPATSFAEYTGRVVLLEFFAHY